MSKINTIICWALIIGFLFPAFAEAQDYINFSKFSGGTGNDETTSTQVINGETYLIGATNSVNFPVTNGSVNNGAIDITIVKYDVNGNVVYATYLGGKGNDLFSAMVVVNGEVYITGTTDSINFPVTNGSVFHGNKDIFLTKIASNGAISFSTYLGGNKADIPISGFLEVFNNEIFIAGNTGSADFPVTNSSVYSGGSSDVFITKLSATNGAVLASGMFGGSNQDVAKKAILENGSLYVVASTLSIDIPVTVGNSLIDGFGNNFAIRTNTSNLGIIYSRYFGGNNQDFVTRAQVVDGILHLAGYTYSTDYPVTNGTAASSALNDFSDGFYTRLNPDGTILFSTYLATPNGDQINEMIISNGNAYLMGSYVLPANGEGYILIYKLNDIGNIVYTKNLFLRAAPPVPGYYEVVGEDLYVACITSTPLFPITDNSQFYGPGSGFLTHLDATGNIVFSGFLGQMSFMLKPVFANNKFYILGTTSTPSYQLTNPGTISGTSDNILIVLNADGSTSLARYIGGSSNEQVSTILVNNNDIYLAGRTSSPDYPVTNNVPFKGSFDQFVTKISFCPNNYFLASDTLLPKTQTVCKFGLGQKITGSEITVPGDSLPLIYQNAVPVQQPAIKATYQWQSADSPTGPWTNIADAVFKDYRPVLGGIDQYYRRLAFSPAECGKGLIHISDTATALVNLLTAPVIDGGGPFITCPGSAITIGGTPTVSGGNPPYSVYAWDIAGVDSVANPIVSPLSSTIYTLIATDAAGCQQIGQSVVITYKANAGPDKGACGGIATQIGAASLTGIPGILYNWQPSTNLSNTSIAQPFANPVVPTNYTLTLTIPKTNSGICETTDTVKVTPVAAPVTPSFAGGDKVFCLDDSVAIGTAPEAGFTYTWSPGSYLTGNTSSIVYYYAGNIIMPVPNPATLYLTAQKNGCSFSDETVVATIEARAGLDGCGPRIIGLPDRTPSINETYAWSIVSGPGGFTGPVNLPQVPVTASSGAPTVYRLTVTYNGHSCTDDVVVPPSCEGCATKINIEASYICPDYEINNGNVTLIATTSLLNPVFTWSPQVGLSNYTGNVVHLTDNVPRIYTVTATDVNNNTIACSDQIFVNDPAFSLPVFPAHDTVTCLGIPVTIGVAPVAGYSYEWTGSGLSSNLISNPVATVNFQTSFPVKVKDANGCQLTDTVTVAVQNVKANAGQDWVICSNSVVKLGVPAQPNTSYVWEPEISPWQNGTNQFSAQPEVFVATDVDFVVTATTTGGCITKDTANIRINNAASIPDAPDKFVCIRNSVMIGSPGLPGVTYQWTPTAGLSNPAVAQPMASPASTTTYTLLATFPGTCATVASDQVTVTVGNAAFNLPDTSYCPANGAVILGDGAPANMVSYNWQPSQLVTNASIPNPSTLNPPPATTTLFTLQVTNTDGCTYKDTIRLTPQITAPAAGPDRLICKGQTTSIGSSSNLPGPTIAYSWSPSANLSDPLSPNPVFTATTGGIFMYVLTKTDNAFSCSSNDTVIIKVIDSLVPVLNPVTACQNTCVQIGTTPVIGINYQWTPSTGLSDPGIANPLACVAAGSTTYTLSGTDIHGCTTSSIAIITVNPIAAPQVTIPAISVCLGDSNIFFNPAVTPAGNYIYNWSPNNGTLSDINILNPEIAITGTGNSSYFLQVTDTTTKCSNTAIGNVMVNLCPVVAVIGDYMWYDNNTDGLQTAGEPGVSGMNVTLFNNAEFNLGSTLTDANGYYHFTNVPPGNGYHVVFSKPALYDFTTRFVGGAGASDNSKANDNGRSNNFNVPAGANITNIDAGIKPGCGVPVTLLSFTATLLNEKVLLNWQTSAEFNNDYFDVEKSNNGIDFTAIGKVDGNGTTSLLHSYAMVDRNPQAGINYYRLKQFDFDGRYNYSPVAIVQLNNKVVISAFYNAASNNIQLVFNKPQNNVSLKLYTNSGQLIKSAVTGNNITAHTLELPALARGIYILQVANEKISYLKKIFIN